MNKLQQRQQHNARQRARRVRAIVSGTAERPRLSVFKSNRGVYVQLVDDEAGRTVASVNVKEVATAGNKTQAAQAAGELIAKKAKELNIERAVFDRGGNKYHGRVKAIADGARAAGLQI